MKNKKYWIKKMIQLNIKAMESDVSYRKAQIAKRQKELLDRKIKKEVKNMEVSDLERVYFLLLNKNKMDTKEFYKRYSEEVLPKLGDLGNEYECDKVCAPLFVAISNRMVEESKIFGLW